MFQSKLSIILALAVERLKNEPVEVCDIFVSFPGGSRIAKTQMWNVGTCLRLQGLCRNFCPVTFLKLIHNKSLESC